MNWIGKYIFGISLPFTFVVPVINVNKSESTGNPTVTVDDSSPMSILQFGAGYAISLSDNISLNPSVGYAMSMELPYKFGAFTPGFGTCGR